MTDYSMKEDLAVRGNKNALAIVLSVAAALHTLFLSIAFAEAFSLIWYNEKDCRAIITGDKYECVSGDCRAILQGNKYACKSDDCRAILEHNKYKCKSDDWRALIQSDKYACKSANCKAILSGNKFECGD